MVDSALDFKWSRVSECLSDKEPTKGLQKEQQDRKSSVNHWPNIEPTSLFTVGPMLVQCWSNVVNALPTLDQRCVNIGQNFIRRANVGPMSDNQLFNVGPTSGQPVG